MTDLLADRFARLVDHDDTIGDWLDVRRRAKPRKKRYLLALVAAAVAVVAVAAAAATGGWIFASGNDNTLTGSTQVQFHGQQFTLHADVQQRWLSLALTRGSEQAIAVASASGGSILAVPGVPQPLLPHPPAPTGPPFGATNYDEGHGQIWFGDARPNITRIEVVDTHGHAFSTNTVQPPPKWKLAFRFWIVALPASTGNTIAGYDNHGKLVQRRSIWGLKSAMYLH
jgi:hypothetical protein